MVPHYLNHKATMSERKIERAQVERTARVYHRKADAAQALGITLSAYYRLLKRYQIEMPKPMAKQSS